MNLEDHLGDIIRKGRMIYNVSVGVAARAVAFLAGRAFVLPEDVQTVFGAVAAHRLVPAAEALLTRDTLAADVLKSVRVD